MTIGTPWSGLKDKAPALYETLWGKASRMAAKEADPERRAVKIVSSTDLAIACDCEDFARNMNSEESADDLKNRVESARRIFVFSQEMKYGVLFFSVEGGKRPHEVTLSKAFDGDTWMCKHCIAVLMRLGSLSQAEKQGYLRVNNLWFKPAEEVLGAKLENRNLE